MVSEQRLTPEEIQVKQQEIVNLTSLLTSTNSDIGDWKINKIYEYRMTGKDDPYDIKELAEKRQAVRDQINELQAELAQIGVENGRE